MCAQTFLILKTCFFAFVAITLAKADIITRLVDGPECVRLGEKCYEFNTERKSWFQAESYCRRNQGYLAGIGNNAEMELITNYLLTHKIAEWRDFWIDGTDIADEGIFRLIRTGNEMPFTKWRNSEPNNQNGKENCVELHQENDVLMNDDDCTVKLASICEYDLNLTILPATNSSSY